MSIFDLLIWLVIVGCIFALFYWLITQIPLPAPFAMVARVVLALAAVILLVGVLTGQVAMTPFRLR